MQIRKPRSWELPDSLVTPEADYLRRRDFLRAVGLGVAATVIFPATIRAATAGFPDMLDPAFKLNGVKLTPYNLITSYNNFYEWGLSKEDPKEFANRGWKTEPWSVEIGGLCAKPARFDVNDLIKTVGGIEQRNYRHRCVEAWSMVIPWDGFPLAKRNLSNSLHFTTLRTVLGNVPMTFPGLIRRALPSTRPGTNWHSWRPASMANRC
jgi:methionine sulfoxide reductase catalytic subunit